MFLQKNGEQEWYYILTITCHGNSSLGRLINYYYHVRSRIGIQMYSSYFMNNR